MTTALSFGPQRLELAHALHRAGQITSAIEVLEQVVVEGGEDGELALVSLAVALFDLEQPERAHSILEDLRRTGSRRAPRRLVAEVLAERGDSKGALRWTELADAELCPPRRTSSLSSVVAPYIGHIAQNRDH